MRWRIVAAGVILEQVDCGELHGFRHHRRMDINRPQRLIELAQIMRPPEHTHESEGRASPGHWFTALYIQSMRIYARSATVCHLAASRARTGEAREIGKYSRFSVPPTRLRWRFRAPLLR
jgi:hypothetical protein